MIYYSLVLETDIGKTRTIRVNNAVPGLDQAVITEAVEKIVLGDCFDQEKGAVTAAKKLTLVEVTRTQMEF